MIRVITVKNIFLLLCLLFIQKKVAAIELSGQTYDIKDKDLMHIDSLLRNENLCFEDNSRPSPLLQLFRTKQKKNKRITAALLAFPFPFGIVGLHRIYLGTAPYVPVAYIATLGGIFGVLPFIDFCVLILDKDEKRYTENKKVFMWIN